MIAITLLAFVRNRATNVLPLILRLFFKVNGTGSRAMAMLSNVGICISGRTVEWLKKRISEDAVAHAINLMTSGHLFCTTFDNINIYLRKFQQRVVNKHAMIHATNCAILAIDKEGLNIKQVEDLETKLKLRGQRVNATFRDILPSRDDDNHIKKAFTVIIAEMLVRYTPGSKDWEGQTKMLDKIKAMTPHDWPLKVKKMDARPFGVFDINEGSKKGIIKVLEAICERSTLTIREWSSKTRLILGDWLTSSNSQGARQDRSDDVDLMERVSYTEELSNLWHYGLQATQ